MLYIISQNGLRIADLKTLSITTPDSDLYEEEVYKVYVNGIEFARYTGKKQVECIMEDVKRFIHMGNFGYFELPPEMAGDYA